MGRWIVPVLERTSAFPVARHIPKWWVNFECQLHRQDLRKVGFVKPQIMPLNSSKHRTAMAGNCGTLVRRHAEKRFKRWTMRPTSGVHEDNRDAGMREERVGVVSDVDHCSMHGCLHKSPSEIYSSILQTRKHDTVIVIHIRRRPFQNKPSAFACFHHCPIVCK